MKKKMIIFESYWGKNYECNPRALYEYIDKNYPKYKTVWSLRDPLTHIEGSAEKIRMHSLKYYYYMATAKYFVNNVNFPDFYRKRKDAVELQTMHGTPLKTLGLDVPGEIKPGKNKEKYLEKNRRWDYLCVPSDYVENIAKRAFDHRAEVIRTGYPRNDKLFFDNRSDKIAQIKKRLGIPENKKIIFYAPTWRVKNYFRIEIDLPRLKELFGDNYVFLIKLHHYVAKSVHIDEEALEGFVYNESSYDDIRDLYLIADILITDYSSVMFDFAILNRPILLYTYDLENYRDNLRGMYFDIIKEAPGPICLTNEDLIRELQNIDRFRENYGKKLDTFRKKFNTYDHGQASEQCFRKMFQK
jgi:CDP-glycerol glycerophosphotransferase